MGVRPRLIAFLLGFCPFAPAASAADLPVDCLRKSLAAVSSFLDSANHPKTAFTRTYREEISRYWFKEFRFLSKDDQLSLTARAGYGAVSIAKNSFKIAYAPAMA